MKVCPHGHSACVGSLFEGQRHKSEQNDLTPQCDSNALPHDRQTQAIGRSLSCFLRHGEHIVRGRPEALVGRGSEQSQNRQFVGHDPGRRRRSWPALPQHFAEQNLRGFVPRLAGLGPPQCRHRSASLPCSPTSPRTRRKAYRPSLFRQGQRIGCTVAFTSG